LDRRYQVFISSTFMDLKDERREAMMALLESDAIPAGMELFQAANDDQWTYIKQVIDQCDYYILIVGGRYGSVNDAGVSFTELEYDYAVSQRKAVMTFIKDGVEDLPAKHVEDSADGRAKLAAFRAKVMKGRMCRSFRTSAELGAYVTRSYIYAKKTSPAEGWVPGRLALTPEIQTELVTLREKVASLTVELAAARLAPPVGSEELAQGDDEYLVHMTFSDHKDTWRVGTQSYTYEYMLSWNQIIGAAGPLLMDECSDTALRAGMAFAIYPFLPKQVRDNAVRSTLALSMDDFQNIKVQLIALGLIMRSDRRRGVNDKDTYWSLTEYGSTTLTRLRAIRKDGRHFYSDSEFKGEDGE
jgi:hypothetical protein